ncbi:unnamed protein product [Cunninghamella blakesleeana]
MTENNRVITINGNDFSTMDEFYDNFTIKFGAPSWFGRNLDAFNDILSNFDKEDIVIWENSDKSKNDFNVPKNDQLLFDLLVEIFNTHIQLILNYK